MKVLPLIFLFFYTYAFQEGNTVVWHPERKLEWGDFKGAPDPFADAAATTVSGLSYSFSGYMERGRLVYVYDVKALFFPEKSWVREELKDEELLLHEQLHFDITAWYAGRLKQAFDTIAPVADPERSVRQVYEQVRKELDSVQDLYDRETDFSRNVKEQLLWEARIRSYLEHTYE